MSDHTSQQQNQNKELFSKILISTIDESRTESEPPQLHSEVTNDKNDDVKNLLLKTFEDPQLQGKTIDFSIQENNGDIQPSVLHSQKWLESDDKDDFNQRLEESIPGRYDIIRPLGEGGFGQVFAARDNNLKRNIAVKFMHPNSKENRIKLFIQEARTTAQLSHPNILPIHDLDYTDGTMPYFTMRKAKGTNLEECIETQHHSIDTFSKRLNIIIKICDALAYAHNKGVIHNDIKPGNIIIGEFGDVMLADWGTSTFTEKSQQPSGRLRGTPMYMAPEQAREELSTQVSDIYQIGCTLFHLLTLRYPYANTENADSFWTAKKTGQYCPPSSSERSKIPPALLAITQKSMQSLCAERYQSVSGLRNDLQNFRDGEPVTCHKDTLWKQIHRIITRNKIILITIAISSIFIFFGAYQLYLEKAQELSNWSATHNESFDVSQEAFADNWVSYLFDSHNATAFKTEELQNRQQSHWYILDSALYSNSHSPDQILNLGSQLTTTKNSRVSWSISSIDKNYNFNAYTGGDNRLNSYNFHIGHSANNNLITLSKGSSRTILSSILLPENLSIGKEYTFSMEKIDEHIQLYLDDILLIDYFDPLPLNGGKHTFFGFESINNIIKIDNIHVSSQPLAKKISPISVADDLYNTGHYNLAYETYSDIRFNYPTSSMAPKALFRSALCLQHIGRINQSKIRLHQFIKSYAAHPYVQYAYAQLTHYAIDDQDKDTTYRYIDILKNTFNDQQSLIMIFEKMSDQILTTYKIVHARATDPELNDSIDKSINEILLLAKKCGVSTQNHSAQKALEPCAQLLLRLGRFNSLEALCPLTPSAAQGFRYMGQMHSLEQNHRLSNEYAHALANTKRYTDLYEHFGGQPNTILEALKKKEHLSEFSHSVPIDSPLQRHLSGHTNTTNEKNMSITGHTNSFVSMQAQTTKIIKSFTTGNVSGSFKAIRDMRSLQNDYKEHVLSSFILLEFTQWTLDNNIDAFNKKVQHHIESLTDRYNELPQDQLRFLIGSIDKESLLSSNSLQLRSQEEKEINILLQAIRYELLSAPLEALKIYNGNTAWAHADLRSFAHWRIKELQQ